MPSKDSFERGILRCPCPFRVNEPLKGRSELEIFSSIMLWFPKLENSYMNRGTSDNPEQRWSLLVPTFHLGPSLGSMYEFYLGGLMNIINGLASGK